MNQHKWSHITHLNEGTFNDLHLFIYLSQIEDADYFNNVRSWVDEYSTDGKVTYQRNYRAGEYCGYGFNEHLDVLNYQLVVTLHHYVDAVAFKLAWGTQ